MATRAADCATPIYIEQVLTIVQICCDGGPLISQVTGHSFEQDGSSVTALPPLSQVTDHVTPSSARDIEATPASDPLATTAVVAI